MAGRNVALALLAHGHDWWVFPVCWRDKVPRVKDWPNVATNDPGRVARWAQGDYNVGICCERSRVVLVDIDGHDAAENLERLRGGRPLPPTFTVSTARAGGLHLWFTAHPEIETRNTKGRPGRGICAGVDTRGVGGFGIAPGSVVNERAYRHPVVLQNGGEYVVVDDRPPAPLPRWLAEAALRTLKIHPKGGNGGKPSDTSQAVQARDAYGNAALQDEYDQLRVMPRDSGRNDQMNRAAFKLATLPPDVLSDEAIFGAMMSAAGENHLLAEDGWERCARTVRGAVQAGRAHPRGRAEMAP